MNHLHGQSLKTLLARPLPVEKQFEGWPAANDHITRMANSLGPWSVGFRPIPHGTELHINRDSTLQLLVPEKYVADLNFVGSMAARWYLVRSATLSRWKENRASPKYRLEVLTDLSNIEFQAVQMGGMGMPARIRWLAGCWPLPVGDPERGPPIIDANSWSY